MKKRIISIIFILFVGVALVMVYRFYVPNYIADVLTSTSPPSYLPEKLKIQVAKIQKSTNKYSEDVLAVSDSAGISLELLLQAIDNADPEELMRTYYILDSLDINSSEEVFEIAIQNITVKEFDVKIFKKVFLKHATLERINRAKTYVRKNPFVTTIAPSTAKKLARQMVIQHYNKLAIK